VSEGKAVHLGVGDGSPGSRKAEGEGGEGFISPEAQMPRFTCNRGKRKIYTGSAPGLQRARLDAGPDVSGYTNRQLI
jgi:hypothetical protein